MRCKHEDDITVEMKEMFWGYHKRKPVHTCMYCGKQRDSKGQIVFDPTWKKDDCQKIKI